MRMILAKRVSLIVALGFSVLAVGAPVLGQEKAATTAPASQGDPSVEDYQAVARKIRPSLVVVEYTLKYDKGEAPYGEGRSDLGYLVRQERPLAVGGAVLSDRLVITADTMIHPRFIKSVNVRVGDKLIPAGCVSYGRDQSAAYLRLDKPIKGAGPLNFSAETEGPYLALTYRRSNARWTVSVKPLAKSVASPAGRAAFRSVPSYCLITDSRGTPAGMSMTGKIPIDDSWKLSPLKWPRISNRQRDEMLDGLKKTVDRGLFRVTLGLRSPKKKKSFSQFGGHDGDESETEKQVVGLLIDKTTVLLLANLSPKVTARLERIRVNLSDGGSASAKFSHTLKDYGCIVARLDKPMDGAVKFSDKDITKFAKLFLPAVEVRLQGEKRVTYYQHLRIRRFHLGWKKHVYPNIPPSRGSTFLFDADGALLALPVIRREKDTRERYGSPEPKLTAATYIDGVLAALAENVDPSNVPLSEEEENRLAWIGVELQPLNKELARINHVSDLTRDGQSGALVSYVYPGSPADQAGIKSGYILLRLHVEDQPKPIEVKYQPGFSWASVVRRPFPWAEYDKLPEQLFDKIPPPWFAAENSLRRRLTDLGFGKKFEAEFFFDGKVVKKDFTVAQSPRHYDTAERFKSKKLGMTVRNMTFELRRYFRKEKGDPGVIVSKIEPGGKASVAGMKPYEIINQVNDQDVRNVDDFKKLIAAGGELRLSVKRWTRGRVVKIKIELPTTKTQPTTQPATQPTTQPATQPTTQPAIKPEPQPTTQPTTQPTG